MIFHIISERLFEQSSNNPLLHGLAQVLCTTSNLVFYGLGPIVCNGLGLIVYNDSSKTTWVNHFHKASYIGPLYSAIILYWTSLELY